MSMNASRTIKFSAGLLAAAAAVAAISLVAAGLSATVASADNGKTLKIGVVNLQTVLEKYQRSVKFQEQWEAKMKEIESQLLALENEMTAKKREMEHTLRTTERYAELFREISLLRQRLEFDSEYLTKQHYELGEKKQREIFAEIETAVKLYAAENSFTAVLMSQELPEKVRERAALNSYFQDLLYYDSAIDVSGPVAEKLNAAAAEETPKEK